MKKEYRIKKNEEFERIISNKHSFANASFVYYIDNKNKDHSRAGVSVSKKLGDAVTRNKIKRQVREMIYSIVDFDSYPFDFIVIVRKGYLERAFIDNQSYLEKLVKKAII